MKLDEAIYCAFDAHFGTTDLSGEPYIKHPLRVMRRIIKDDYKPSKFPSLHSAYKEPYFWPEDVLVVAVLHDVMEDTDYILRYLNEAQSDAMGAITRHFAEFEGETYKEYIARCCQNPIARIVKYYDLHDNLSPERMSYLEKGVAKGLRKRYEWSLEYIKGL